MSATFAKNIKTFRKIQGITQKSLSVTLGVSRTTISAWENKVSEPDLTTLGRIKDVLNVSYEELLDD